MLRDVTAELRGLIDEADRRAERSGSLCAELRPDTPAKWHVLMVAPQHEAIAAGHLVGRRFGVYLPMVMRTTVTRDRKRVTQYPMFPGYLFLFGWGVATQQSRILACPGAIRMLCAEDGVLATVPDELIQRIQIAEAKEDQAIQAAVQAVADTDAAMAGPKRTKRRKWRRVPEPAGVRHAGPIDLVISTRSFPLDISGLSDSDRIGLLHEQIGLGSSVA